MMLNSFGSYEVSITYETHSWWNSWFEHKWTCLEGLEGYVEYFIPLHLFIYMSCFAVMYKFMFYSTYLYVHVISIGKMFLHSNSKQKPRAYENGNIISMSSAIVWCIHENDAKAQ